MSDNSEFFGHCLTGQILIFTDYSNPDYTVVTDALGRVTKYYYDRSRGRAVITKIEGVCACGAGGGSQVTSYEYDSQLNLTSMTDAAGLVTTYTYDGFGNHLTMTDVLGTETYTYNSFGQILTKIDRMNGLMTNSYDANTNLLTDKACFNYTMSFT